jgi:hypothetical protein
MLKFILAAALSFGAVAFAEGEAANETAPTGTEMPKAEKAPEKAEKAAKHHAKGMKKAEKKHNKAE